MLLFPFFLPPTTLLLLRVNWEKEGRRGYTEPISHLITWLIKLWQQILTRIQHAAAMPQTYSFPASFNSLPLIKNKPANSSYWWPTNSVSAFFDWESFPEIPFYPKVFSAKVKYSAKERCYVIFNTINKLLGALFLIMALIMTNSFQKHAREHAEEFEGFVSVVWIAPLLTQTQGHWAALSVLLDFNRLKGTGDENNFLLVYLRDSYSNYGNLTRPNLHIFSVSSLI